MLRGGLARTSLRLSVIDGLSVLERYAWIDTALHTLPGSGIVYVPTVAETDRLADYLSSRGHAVAAYSGQLDTDLRAQVEDRLRANELKAVVATSALGMGYDKPDLGFCVHLGSPDSPVAYYQQVGRAGRAIDSAEAVLLPAAESDERIWEYFATAAIPDPRNVTPVLDALTHEGGPLSVPALEALTGIRRGRLEALLKVIAVDGAVERTTGGWIATGEPYVFDAEKWAAIRATRQAEADLMRAYAGGRGCLMEFLQRALDDPDPGPCGRCSVCTGELPAPGRDLDPAALEDVQAHLRGVDTVLEPRKRWPNGLADGHSGVIVGATHGRALTFADTPGWLDAVRALDAPDAPLPDDVVDGMVTVLTRWRHTWAERPVAVVPMPSRRHPVLVRDLAERIAAVGKLALVDALTVDGPRPPTDTASGPRVDALFAALAVRPDVRAPDRRPDPARRRHLPLRLDHDRRRRPPPRRRRPRGHAPRRATPALSRPPRFSRRLCGGTLVNTRSRRRPVASPETECDRETMMTVEEVRTRLRARLEAEYGVDEASILMDRPPGGWGDLATHRDLAELERRIDLKFEALEARIDARFTGVDGQFIGIERRFDAIEHALTASSTSSWAWSTGVCAPRAGGRSPPSSRPWASSSAWSSCSADLLWFDPPEATPLSTIKAAVDGREHGVVIVGFGDDLEAADYLSLTIPDAPDLVHLLEQALAMPTPGGAS